jgi:hypothetical protein
MLYPDYESVRRTGDRHDDYLLEAERKRLAPGLPDAVTAGVPGSTDTPRMPALDAAWRRVLRHLRPHRQAHAHR